jgi:hypothetical protein
LLEIDDVRVANKYAIDLNNTKEEELKLRTSENEHIRSNLSAE